MLNLRRENSNEDVIRGKPIKKLKVGYEGKTTNQYNQEVENARDFNDQIAELLANKESNPDQYAIGIDRVQAVISKAKQISASKPDPTQSKNSKPIQQPIKQSVPSVSDNRVYTS